MDGIRRCRNFLDKAGTKIIRQAMDAIDRQFSALENSPEIGRPFSNNPDLRELVIPFGNSGYLALYRYDSDRDAVLILAFRHQREAGY